MKRMYALLLSTILLLSCLTVLTLSGCGDGSPQWMSWPESPTEDFSYTLSDDGSEVYIQKYLGSDERVVIPSHIDGLPVVSLKGVVGEKSGFTYIEEGVFQGNTTVKEVVLPATLKAIGSSAFEACTGLTAVYVPQDSPLHVISPSAFEGCTSLEALDLSSTAVWIIADNAFYGCTSLREITFPETLTEIRKQAFYECKSLIELKFPSSLTTIEREAFWYCESLEKVNIPVNLNLTAHEQIRFNEVPALKQITVDEGREVLDGYAFFAITGTTEIVIPAGVKALDPDVFFMYGDNVSMKFLGDCPELTREVADFPGTPTFYYDPATKGWEDCPWKGDYTFKPIE